MEYPHGVRNATNQNKSSMSQPTHISATYLPGPFPENDDGTPAHGLATLAQLFRNPHELGREEIDAQCSQGCGATIRCMAYFASHTACDDCRAKHDKKERLDRAKGYWESIIPPLYRETDKNHPDFPKGAYEQTKEYAGQESLFIFGDSRTGKTRIAVLLLKRCLIRFNMHVGVLWPEVLKSVKNTREVLQMVEKWGRYDVLLMDDALLTGAQDERVTDFLKDLIDYRMRYKRHIIITSQISDVEYLDQSDKFEKATKADKARVEALLKRIKEIAKVVTTGISQPVQSNQNQKSGDLF